MATESDMAAVIQAARDKADPQIIDVADGLDFAAPILAVPKAGGGFDTYQDLKPVVDKWRPNPERRKGTATLLDLASFIAHAQRFKTPESAVFVTEEPPRFTSVLNYHDRVNSEGWAPGGDPGAPVPLPRFGDHRGVYAPAFSPEWQAWAGEEGADGEWLDQAQFSALIVDNARDIFDLGTFRPGEALGELATWFASRFGRNLAPEQFFAGTQRLLDLAEGLTVTVEDKVEDTARLDGGAQTIAWSGKTSTSVEVPGAFVIAIPVFDGGDPYQIPARLRFKLVPYGESKRVTWKVDLYGVKRTLRACLADMRETVNKGTGLPSFLGSPE
jgi:hypothetical protein